MSIACLNLKICFADCKCVKQGMVYSLFKFFDDLKALLRKMLKFLKFCSRKFQNKLLPSHFTTLLIRTNLNWKGLLLFSLNMFISFSDIQSICDLANSTTLKATLFRSARLYARRPESYMILISLILPTPNIAKRLYQQHNLEYQFALVLM